MKTSTFESLLESLQPTIKNVARRFASTSPGMELDDLTQEIALKLWQERDSLTGPDDATAWAARIALNHCTDIQRADMRRIDTAGSDALDYAADHVYRVSDQPEHDVEREAEAESLSRTLDAAMARLPESDREIFKAYAEGEKQESIAARVGISHAAMRQRITRIRARLASDLSAFDPADSADVGETQWIDGTGGATPAAPNYDEVDSYE